MAQFPVESQTSLVEAVNYLLSGPGGLGQNFQGFSDYQGAYLTGTFRAPFSVPLTTTDVPTWYVAPVTITNITVPVNPGRYLYITLSGWVGTSPPFAPGDTVTIAGVVDSNSSNFFNDTYVRSVVSCTTTQLILQTSQDYTWPSYVSGGTVGKNVANTENSTDCNARVTVYGPTDRVFISAQLNLDISYTCDTPSEFDVIVRINRYRGTPTTTAGDNDYTFDLDTNPIVSEQTTHYSVAGVPDSTGNVEYIFTTVLDQPSFGYYWYILDVIFFTYDPLVGGLLKQPYGSTARYTYSGTAATQAATTDYVNLVPTTLTGIGSGADIDVQLLVGASTAYSEENVTINYINTAGTDYAVGDTIKILGTDLGGASPANDLTLTLVEIDPQPYPGNALPNVATAGLRSFTAQVIKQ